MLYLLFLAVVLCAVIVYLPYSAGLTHIEKQKKQKPQRKAESAPEETGYIPPDEQLRRQQEEERSRSLKARASGFKQKMTVTNDDVPVKIRLNNEETLTRRKEKLSADLNPDHYDYDLDQLIREETQPQVEKPPQYQTKEDLV